MAAVRQERKNMKAGLQTRLRQLEKLRGLANRIDLAEALAAALRRREMGDEEYVKTLSLPARAVMAMPTSGKMGSGGV